MTYSKTLGQCKKVNIQCYDGKFILKKIDSKSDTFDLLLYGDRKLETVTIPPFIKIIAPYCFNNCEHLEKVEFSNDSKLIRIEKCAFQDVSIESILIPSSVSVIESKALNCAVLEKVEFEDNSDLVSIGSDCFSVDLSKKIALTIPYSVIEFNTHWGDFSSYENITITPNKNKNCFSVLNNEIIVARSDLNSDVFDVLLGVFENVEVLKVPSSIKIIAPYSLYGHKKIKIVEFTEDSELNFIGKYAFQSFSLQHIHLPPHAIQIDEEAFVEDIEIGKLHFFEGTKIHFIGKELYSSSPKYKISIPLNVLSKLKCNWLNLVSGLCEISISSDEGNCLLYENNILLCKSDEKSDVFDVLLFGSPDVEEVKVPFYVKQIAQNAFCKSNMLHKIEFEEQSKLVEIGDVSFKNTDIDSISIPSSVKKLETVHFVHVKILNMNNNLFKYENEFILTKSNPDFDVFDVLLFAKHDIKNAIIPSCIKIIAPYAFNSCNELETVSFSKDCQIESIGNNGFSNSSLTKITIPSSVKTIGIECFCCCTQLNKFEYSEKAKIESIGQKCFDGSGIGKIEIPSSLKVIESFAFRSCNNLELVSITENSKLEYIGMKAFYDTFIHSFLVPPYVSFLGRAAFSLSDIHIVQFSENPEVKELNSLMTFDSEDLIVMLPANQFIKINPLLS